ncbi:TetR family transcriptional regulator [Actinomyces oris]|uniref:TetR family transcriptional regulator n=3 Tax=Actinomycetaceae TaxID=2049 RepID=A0A1Q8VD30_9ACTO|nr:TetR family transcriptional regulator [Actinomyces sp. oral taxon 171]OLO45993.1 TetR family transcriptional regulator [Actinomyces oris]OLO47162.1 TetR family transcriptional regulator [Actinomyces oris]QCT34287.1 TetR family transcriptional regulator [Actinomyces sp. oral taxon 171 str. F0337]
MFTEQGFDAVPVTAIAKAAGVSHMTFFRHFPTKEAVVVSDLFNPLIAEAVRAQPQRWRPLTRAVRGLVAAMSQESARKEMSSQEFHERIRLAALTPSLAAAVRTAGQETERAIAAALAAPGVDDAAARAAAGAVMGAASSLLLAWAGESNAADTGAADAAATLSRGLLSLLGEA